MRLRIEETPLDLDIWGSLIDVEVKDEGEELSVLEFAKAHFKRKHELFHDEKATGKSIAERISELKGRGVKPKRRVKGEALP